MQPRFPVTLTFKILALAPQISVRDAEEREILYVQQKLFKLKEQVRVFRDRSKSEQVYGIEADRVLDISATYRFTDASGQALGSVRREGLKSLWKARYVVADASGHEELVIEEENPWVKLLDGVLGEIPVLGALTGFFLHPRYAISRPDAAQPVLRITKRRSFLESRFNVTPPEQHIPLEAETATRVLLAVLMMVLLERNRG